MVMIRVTPKMEPVNFNTSSATRIETVPVSDPGPHGSPDNVVVTTLPELQADQTCVVQEGDVPRDPRGGRCQQSDAMTCPFYGDGIAIASWQSCYARGPLRSVRRSRKTATCQKPEMSAPCPSDCCEPQAPTSHAGPMVRNSVGPTFKGKAVP